MSLSQLTAIPISKLLGDFYSKLVRLTLSVNGVYCLHGVVDDAFIDLHELLLFVFVDSFDIFEGFEERDILKVVELERFYAFEQRTMLFLHSQ